MPEDSNYWDKFWQKRYSRRRLISGTALAGTGLAAGAVVGCGGESGTDPTAPAPSGSTDAGLYCGDDATPGEKYLVPAVRHARRRPQDVHAGAG